MNEALPPGSTDRRKHPYLDRFRFVGEFTAQFTSRMRRGLSAAFSRSQVEADAALYVKQPKYAH